MAPHNTGNYCASFQRVDKNPEAVPGEAGNANWPSDDHQKETTCVICTMQQEVKYN